MVSFTLMRLEWGSVQANAASTSRTEEKRKKVPCWISDERVHSIVYLWTDHAVSSDTIEEVRDFPDQQ